jgi:PTS system nitrogen regulatory IIA component
MKLTIEDAAKCLDVPSSTVERWIRQGRIPIQKSGKVCLFQRQVLETWAARHNLRFSFPKEESTFTEHKPETVAAALRRGAIRYHLQGDSVETVLKSLVDSMESWTDSFKLDLYEKLLEREGLNSTGIGKGVAIPHPRSPISDETLTPVIVAGFLRKPVKFKAVDDLPVFVLFLLLSASVQTHLQLLSRLAFCFRSDPFLQFLKSSPAESDLIAEFEAIESQIDAV